MTLGKSRRKRYQATIEPIRSRADIERVRTVLSDNPRDLLLFDLATRTGLGLNQLLTLKVKDLLDLGPGESLVLPAAKEGAPASLDMTDSLFTIWQRYLEEVKPDKNDFLIKSKRENKPLNINSVSNKVAAWFKSAGLEGLTGYSSLRKTWEKHFASHPTEAENPTRGLDKEDLLKPIEISATTQEKVYRSLYRAIISGRIMPGEKLSLKMLSQRMKIGQTPIRAALNKLEAAGFITVYDKIGSVVNELSLESLREINEIRHVVERLAVNKAAPNWSDQTVADLEVILKGIYASVRINDPERFIHLNREFRRVIYRAADSPILAQTIEGFYDRISPYLHISTGELDIISPGFKNTSADYHQEMLKAVKRRDAKAVYKWLKIDREKTEILLGKAFRQIKQFTES